ncbi:trimeric intracellular cation channel family protein [soil metagenome]
MTAPHEIAFDPAIGRTMRMALDYAGVGFFAATGAIAAGERRQDIVGFLFFAALTGIGGGTLRELLIGAPVFWVREPAYLLVCGGAAVVIWGLRGRGLDPRALLWLDAVGLAAYAVVGASKAEAAGLGASVCVVMGVLTAAFGGVLRDIVAEQPSVLLRREIYVTAAIGAAAVHVSLRGLGAPDWAATLFAVVAGLTLRGGALLFNWRLPQFAPAREPPAGA